MAAHENDRTPGERYVWIGMVTDDLNARAVRIGVLSELERIGETPAHHDYNMEGGKRWRYPEGADAVFWWEPPTDDEKQAVDDFMQRKGLVRVRHTDSYRFDGEDAEGPDYDHFYEVAHGHLDISNSAEYAFSPNRLRTKGKARMAGSYAAESLDNPYRSRGSFSTYEEEVEDEETGEIHVENKLSPVQIVHFKTDAGVPYVWYARQSRYDDTRWEIAFGEHETTDPHNGALLLNTKTTGRGDAFRVFATVLEITNQFIEFDDNYEVRTLSFTAKGDNRSSLYAKRLAPRLDKFKITDVRTVDGESTITMSRTESIAACVIKSLVG
jgi:hypothetical protein